MAELDDLEFLEMLESIERRPRFIVADRECDLDVLDDVDFKRRYRLDKETVLELANMFRDRLSADSQQNNPFSPEEKICMALRYYSSGPFQQIVGDLGEASQPSACRAIHAVSRCLASLRPTYITLPETEEERREISQKFFAVSGFPGVYGCIDCTHIPIVSPGGPRAETFRCRKGYFSINVQTVSDPDLMIRNIVACWPGSTHDMTIFRNSSLYAMFETGQVPPVYHLLGDNGYGCQPYLLTPFLEPRLEAERRYNSAHVTTCNTVERQYGVWKRRFSCLSSKLLCSTANAMTVIVATAVLHNIAIKKSITLDEEIDDINEDGLANHRRIFDNAAMPNNNCVAGFAKRHAIVDDFFSSDV